MLQSVHLNERFLQISILDARSLLVGGFLPNHLSVTYRRMELVSLAFGDFRAPLSYRVSPFIRPLSRGPVELGPLPRIESRNPHPLCSKVCPPNPRRLRKEASLQRVRPTGSKA